MLLLYCSTDHKPRPSVQPGSPLFGTALLVSRTATGWVLLVHSWLYFRCKGWVRIYQLHVLQDFAAGMWQQSPILAAGVRCFCRPATGGQGSRTKLFTAVVWNWQTFPAVETCSILHMCGVCSLLLCKENNNNLLRVMQLAQWVLLCIEGVEKHGCQKCKLITLTAKQVTLAER